MTTDAVRFRRRRWFVLAGAAILLVGLIVVIVSVITRPAPMANDSTPPASTALRVGDRVPTTGSFAELVGDHQGSIATLSDRRPTVINFFASFCTACAAEMATFGSVAHTDHGVAFIGIDTNEPDVGKARSIVEHAHVAYPVLRDNAALALANAYGVANLPTTFFIDAHGTITAEVLGTETAAQLRAHIATTS